MSRFLLALALLLSALVPSAGQAKRVALIIGMSDYQHLSSLINPVPDARAIAAELKSHGFEVSDVLAVLRATKVAGLPIPGRLLPPVAPSRARGWLELQGLRDLSRHGIRARRALHHGLRQGREGAAGGAAA